MQGLAPFGPLELATIDPFEIDQVWSEARLWGAPLLSAKFGIAVPGGTYLTCREVEI